jgi:hypothetical protein
MSSRAAALVLLLCLTSFDGAGDAAAQRPDPDARQRAYTLDAAFERYAQGDHQIIARTFQRSIDFQRLRINNRRRLDAWLGPWRKDRAAFVLELTYVSSLVAPAYTPFLLKPSQDYVVRAANSGLVDVGFERLWHRVAVAMLQRRMTTHEVDHYLQAIEAAAPANGAPRASDARWRLARGIAQEQRCWLSRPSLSSAGAPSDEVTQASEREPDRAARKLAGAERLRHRTCLLESASLFERAATDDETRAEARVRGAWARVQLEEFAAANALLDGIDAGDDRPLAYWAALFRGRALTGSRQHDAAVRAYITALELFPDAQSAAVGRALALYSADRYAEADAAAAALRGKALNAADPWSTYFIADDRFLTGWIAHLREAIP